MKRFILFTAMVVGGGVLAIGPGFTWSYLKGLRTGVINDAEESLPDEQIVAKAQDELKQFNATVRTYGITLAGVGDKLATAKAQAEKIHKQLDAEKKILVRVKQSLESSDCRFEVNGRVYTRDDMERDGQARLARCQSLDGQLRSQQKLIAELTKAHDDGRKWLDEAEQVRNQRAAELEALKVRLANARARGELGNANLSPPLTADTDSGRQLGALNDRVKKLEWGNDIDAATSNGRVNWAPANGTRDAITQYLKGDEASAARTKP